MVRHTGQAALQDTVLRAIDGHAAAGFVGDGDHSVNIWEVRERFSADFIGNQVNCVGRAVNSGNE